MNDLYKQVAGYLLLVVATITGVFLIMNPTALVFGIACIGLFAFKELKWFDTLDVFKDAFFKLKD